MENIENKINNLPSIDNLKEAVQEWDYANILKLEWVSKNFDEEQISKIDKVYSTQLTKIWIDFDNLKKKLKVEIA